MTATVTALAERVTALETALESLTTTVNGKANKSTTLAGYGITDGVTAKVASETYVTQETYKTLSYKVSGHDTEISNLKTADTAIKAQVNGQATLITALQNGKADSADVYTKTEADAKFALKTTT